MSEGRYFMSTVFEWRATDTLQEATKEIQKMTRKKNGVEPELLCLARVPLPRDANYEIDNYVPKVQGTVIITNAGAGVIKGEEQ